MQVTIGRWFGREGRTSLPGENMEVSRGHMRETEIRVLLQDIGGDDRIPRRPGKTVNLARIAQLARSKEKHVGEEKIRMRKRISSQPSKAWIERMAAPKKRDVKESFREYLPGRSRWDLPSGGKFNLSQPKTWIEWNVYLNKDIPGPGKYCTQDMVQLSGGRFNEARPLSSLDLAILHAKDSPGPGEYGATSSLLSSAGVGKMVTSRGQTYLDQVLLEKRSIPGPAHYQRHWFDSHRIPGGKFGNQNPPSQLDLAIRRSKDLPGPMDYYPERSYKSVLKR